MKKICLYIYLLFLGIIFLFQATLFTILFLIIILSWKEDFSLKSIDNCYICINLILLTFSLASNIISYNFGIKILETGLYNKRTIILTLFCIPIFVIVFFILLISYGVCFGNGWQPQ